MPWLTAFACAATGLEIAAPEESRRTHLAIFETNRREADYEYYTLLRRSAVRSFSSTVAFWTSNS